MTYDRHGLTIDYGNTNHIVTPTVTNESAVPLCDSCFVSPRWTEKMRPLQVACDPVENQTCSSAKYKGASEEAKVDVVQLDETQSHCAVCLLVPPRYACKWDDSLQAWANQSPTCQLLVVRGSRESVGSFSFDRDVPSSPSRLDDGLCLRTNFQHAAQLPRVPRTVLRATNRP